MANEYETVRYEEEFILNSRGMKLFTCNWVPKDCEPKALIFLCHGYAMECSMSMKGNNFLYWVENLSKTVSLP
ncbi:hypothetical protein MTR67_016833 [Solanum verrucosum]|uniref:Uncharacterized protein n=1 Tax=Solanum verrucosum TaxID=315347 RepID=A0AAF0QJ70_SOLVR|nr:hypothetical protein MTR67_016833 [Solanum verrucosum]